MILSLLLRVILTYGKFRKNNISLAHSITDLNLLKLPEEKEKEPDSGVSQDKNIEKISKNPSTFSWTSKEIEKEVAYFDIEKQDFCTR